jgi:hypothetical protein
MKKQSKTGICLFDLHYPEHDSKCLNITYDITSDLKPDYFILGGDQLDMGCISYFNRGKIKLLENKRIGRDYKGFQKILDKYEGLLPESCEKVFMIGNHEYRVTRLIEENPQAYEGILEIENNLDLSDWKVIPFNRIFSIGYLNIIHGIYWNIHHTKKHLYTYGDNIYYGHVHNSQSFSIQTPLNNEPKEARSVGCLCNKNPEWKRERPNDWINELLVFESLPNGIYFPCVVRIINGKTIFRGEVYKG